MYPSSTNIIPELQSYFQKFIITAELNKQGVPLGVQICNSFLNKNSFIRLLFDDDWPTTFTSYRYLYREISGPGSWPAIIRERAMIYPTSAKYYQSDSDSTAVCDLNVFNLKENCDIVLLDALLKLRLTDSTSLIVIDSTSVVDPIFTDSTSADTTAVLTVNYNTLTRFSKLIFLYLNLQVNNNTSYYNNRDLIALPTDVLESIYETYILEKMFRHIADRGR